MAPGNLTSTLTLLVVMMMMMVMGGLWVGGVVQGGEGGGGGVRGGGSDVYLSTAETALLLQSERQLVGFVQRHLARTAHTTGDPELSRLARELQTELDSVPVSQDARHPLDAYAGLRRFTQYWGKYITRLDPVVATSVEDSLSKAHIGYPDDATLRQARRAIVRLQASYHLPPSSLLASGTTGANLTAPDLQSLAAEAQDLGFVSLAEQWRNESMRRFAGAGDGPRSSSGWSVHAYSSVQRGSLKEREERMETRLIHSAHTRFFTLCQKLWNSSDTSVLSSQRCQYRPGSTNPLSRWKTEVLSDHPPVLLVYDFVSDKEARVIMNTALSGLRQAYTGNSHDDHHYLRVQRRLGKVAWLADRRSPSLKRLNDRIQDVTGLHTAYRPQRSFGEIYQVVNYGIGGQYTQHHDYFRTKDKFKDAEEYLHESGDRAATFMIYLGDVSQGGATVFPELGIGAPPVKRAALFWHNFSPDGVPDPRSLHGGCPVIIGEKWVANKWIHEIGTAMTGSCGLTPRSADQT